MEIYGDTAIRLDQVELVLKACTAFRIERLEGFYPEWHEYDSLNETSDDEEPDGADVEPEDALRTNKRMPV
jgi:hypothetical protein